MNSNLSHQAFPLLPFIQHPLMEEDAERISGPKRGVQGKQNSCYLDATLFSMFSFSSVFDTLLIPEPRSESPGPDNTSIPMNDNMNGESADDEELANEVRQLLRDGIVNPLRKDLFAPACNVMSLRRRMGHLDDKLLTEEMDPQEYLQLLFHNVLHLEDFISLSSADANAENSDYFHQVLVQNSDNDSTTVPTIQQLLEKSLTDQKLKMKKIPSPALILQMPRSGNQYKMYNGILPNLTIDITDLLEDTPRTCIICGTLATQECPSCFGKFPAVPKDPKDGQQQQREVKSGADSTAFCGTCVVAVHNRADRASHKETITNLSYSFSSDTFFKSTLYNSTRNMNGGFLSSISSGLSSLTRSSSSIGGGANNHHSNNANAIQQRLQTKTIPRVTMDLFAVICIETSHFVSFVKCGSNRLAPWVFFDSMADRVEKMDGTGHNIPQVKLLPKMGTWLSSLEAEPQDQLKDRMTTMTVELRRLLNDPYICFYHSPEVSMYS